MSAKKSVVLGLLPLYDYYERNIKPHIGPMAAITDPQEVIYGEVYLLMGMEHEPNQATVRKLIYSSVPPDYRDRLLSNFTNLALELLKVADVVESDYVEIVPMDGYALVVKPYMPVNHIY